MNLLDDESAVLAEKRTASKNLQTASASFALLLVSSIVFMIYLSTFKPGNSHSAAISWIFIILFFGIKILSAVFAVLILRNAFSAVSQSKNFRNYIAITIGILVLLAIGNDLFHRI